MKNEDKLTSLKNHDFYLINEEKIFKDILKDYKKGKNTSILYCDIDNLKLINDKYGHDDGDKLIKEFSGAIISSIRMKRNDLFFKKPLHFRVGGDEFVIFLKNTNLSDSKKVKKRILDKIKNSHFYSKGASLSIGISSTSEKQINNIDDIISLKLDAENEMYLDKKIDIKKIDKNKQYTTIENILSRIDNIGLDFSKKEDIDYFINLLKSYNVDK